MPRLSRTRVRSFVPLSLLPPWSLTLAAPVTVTLLTTWLFCTLVYLSGFLANGLIAAVESRQSALSGSIFDGAPHNLLQTVPAQADSEVPSQTYS